MQHCLTVHTEIISFLSIINMFQPIMLCRFIVFYLVIYVMYSSIQSRCIYLFSFLFRKKNNVLMCWLSSIEQVLDNNMLWLQYFYCCIFVYQKCPIMTQSTILKETWFFFVFTGVWIQDIEGGAFYLSGAIAYTYTNFL